MATRNPLPQVSPLQWLALTVKQEAEGEPYEGKVAVAFCIMNRQKKTKQSVSSVVLAPFQFSCWNTDSPTRKNLSGIDPLLWDACCEAATTAYLGLEPDPTKGATHYLNAPLVKKVSGKLPSWFDDSKVTAVIGKHTFLKL